MQKHWQHDLPVLPIKAWCIQQVHPGSLLGRWPCTKTCEAVVPPLVLTASLQTVVVLRGKIGRQKALLMVWCPRMKTLACSPRSVLLAFQMTLSRSSGGFLICSLSLYSLQEASDDAIAGNFKFLKITESMKQILFWLVKYQWLKATGFSPSVPRDKAAYVVTGLVSVTWLIASQYMVHLDFWLLGENIFRSIFLHYKDFWCLLVYKKTQSKSHLYLN